jgi:protein-tyrosine phosphatase
MAEAVLRATFERAGLSSQVIVDSAGTAGWHEGDGADARALRTLQHAGYPLRHRARQFRREWFASTDLVLAMDAANLSDLQLLARGVDDASAKIRLLRSFDPAADDLEVPDPYYGGDEGFLEVLGMIERASDGVVSHVRRRLDG